MQIVKGLFFEGQAPTFDQDKAEEVGFFGGIDLQPNGDVNEVMVFQTKAGNAYQVIGTTEEFERVILGLYEVHAMAETLRKHPEARAAYIEGLREKMKSR